MHIRLVDGHTLSIRVGGTSRRVTFAELGLHDGRTKRPNLQWELLLTFAQGHGRLNWDDRKAGRKNQKRKEELAKALRKYFGIAEDPFAAENGGWRTKFSIEG